MTTEPTSNADAGGSQVERGVRPVAYLYHDASTPEEVHPWLHSTLLVLAADRRPTLRNETPLVTLAQADAMVAAASARITELEAADEGARVAYGHLSAQKRTLERECTHLRGLLDDAHAQIRRQAEMLNSRA